MTIPASDVIQDESRRFVSDLQIAQWNAAIPAPGVIAFQSLVFRRSPVMIVPESQEWPEGGSFADPVPSNGFWTKIPVPGPHPLYVSIRIFTSDGAYPQDQEWSPPVIMVEHGQQGAAGAAGQDGTPGTNGTAGATGQAGVNGSAGISGTSIRWVGEATSHPINPVDGIAYRNTVDKKSYVYYDDTDDGIANGTWYQMTVDGIDGGNGDNGISVVWKGEYEDVAALEAVHGNSELNWAYRDTTNMRVYICVNADRPPTYELMVVDGTDGANAWNGMTLMAYKRSAAAPIDNPGEVIYDFTDASWTPGNGWSKTIPTTDGNPVWAVAATAAAQANTDTIPAEDWSGPAKVAEDGSPGPTAVMVLIFQRTDTDVAPALPSVTSTYTFATGAVTGLNNGWASIIPTATATNKYLWATQATALSSEATDEILAAEWQDPEKLSEDGLSVYITYHDGPASAAPPAKPTNVAGTNNGWHTDPTAAANWMSQKVDNGTTTAWGEPIQITGQDGSQTFRPNELWNPAGALGYSHWVAIAGTPANWPAIKADGEGYYWSLGTAGSNLNYALGGDLIAVTPGQDICISGWLKTTGLTAGEIGVKCVYYDSNSQVIGTAGPKISRTSVGDFAYYSDASTVPVGAAFVQVQQYASGFSGLTNVGIRMIKLEWGPEATPYNDPSSQGTIGAPEGTYVGTSDALTVSAATVNFDLRNDRLGTPINDPAAVTASSTLNADGSANLKLTWTWTAGLATKALDDATIDGFGVYGYFSDADAAYAFGTTPGSEYWFQLAPDKREWQFHGVPATKFYTLGVVAFRSVDPDVVAGRLITSAIVQATRHRPSATVELATTVVVDNSNNDPVQLGVIATGLTNFNNRNDRMNGAIGDPSAPTVTYTTNDDGSANVKVTWVWGGNNDQIDGWLLYGYMSDTADGYVMGTTVASEYSFTVEATKREWSMQGIPANKYYRFGLKAYRVVDPDINAAGVIYSILTSSTQTRPAATVNIASTVTLDTTPISTIKATTTNFDARNDRMTAAGYPIATPTSPAVAYEANQDGSINLTFTWAWGGTEAQIDGFIIYGYMSDTNDGYSFGSTPASEYIFEVTAEKRVFKVQGLPSIKFYKLGVKAYRRVDPDIDASGILYSAMAASTQTQPSTAVSIGGPQTYIQTFDKFTDYVYCGAFVAGATYLAERTRVDIVHATNNQCYYAKTSGIKNTAPQSDSTNWGALTITQLGYTPTWKGAWSTVAYAKNDVVIDASLAWVCTAAHTGSTALRPYNGTGDWHLYWKIINSGVYIGPQGNVGFSGIRAVFGTPSSTSMVIHSVYDRSNGCVDFYHGGINSSSRFLSLGYNPGASVTKTIEIDHTGNATLNGYNAIVGRVDNNSVIEAHSRGSGYPVYGTISSAASAIAALYGLAQNGYSGIRGDSDYYNAGNPDNSGASNGVYGYHAYGGNGVRGRSVSGHGIRGISQAAAKAGVYGTNDAAGGIGVLGETSGYAVKGVTTGTGYAGVRGEGGTNSVGVSATSAYAARGAVEGTNSSTTGYGVKGIASAASGSCFGGVFDATSSASGVGVYSTGTAWDFYAAGDTTGFYTVSPGNDVYYSNSTSYGPFTGAHDGLVTHDFNAEPGDIIIDLGPLNKKGISNTIGLHSVSTQVKQKSAVGVVISLGDLDPEQAIVALPYPWPVDYSLQYRRITFNAVGEGMINVCKDGGNIEIGDYICSSNRPGKGMKQDDDLLHNYTVAKAREAVVWEEGDDSIKQIACSYHSC
jgi:hypothetical protein